VFCWSNYVASYPTGSEIDVWRFDCPCATGAYHWAMSRIRLDADPSDRWVAGDVLVREEPDEEEDDEEGDGEEKEGEEEDDKGYSE
jgi:hypothetical protein